MISPMFNDPNYQSLRTLLDVAMVRHKALAGNVANVNTPGYQRSDISSTFQQELQKAVEAGDLEKLRSMTPKLQTDTETPSLRMDGNNVNLEREMVEIAKNSIQFETSAAFLTRRYQDLRMAITGK